jgi:uncharacterized protein (DUF58 family)
MTAIFKRFLRYFYRRRSLRFTPAGTRFVLMTLAVGLAAINTRNNLLYLILAMMLSFIILSGILSEEALRHLRVERILPMNPFAGKSLRMYYQVISGRRQFSSYCLSIQEMENAGFQSKSIYMDKLAAGQRNLSSTQILFPHRGLYHFEGVRLETTFPFGFFRKRLFYEQPQKMIVYPKLIHLPPGLLNRLTASGETHEMQFIGQGSSIRGLRDYTPLDDARVIHWRASARQNKLLSKEYEHEEEQRLTICLSHHLPKPVTEENRDFLEKAISLAASLSYHWLMEGHAVEVQTLTRRVKMGKGLSQLNEILCMLALLEPVHGTSYTERAHEDRSSLRAPRILILPREDSVWKKRDGFTRVLTVTDPELLTWMISKNRDAEGFLHEPQAGS